MTNKKVTIFFSTLIVALFCSTNLYAQKTIVGGKDLPLELNLLLESFQVNDTDSFRKVLPIISNIDLSARAMTKEDIFFLGKIEIYKTILKNYDTVIKRPIDGLAIKLLRSAIAKSKDNFTTWFLQALLKDCLDLLTNPLYKEFLLQKNSNVKIEKAEYRKLEKKGELLQYWISKISPDAQDFPETLMSSLKPKMLKALINIQNSFSLMAKETSISPILSPLKDESELKYFTIKEVSKMPPNLPPKTKDKSVEEILSPITGDSPLDLPMPSQENWLEDQNTPPELQNLPKPSNDADWLQDF